MPPLPRLGGSVGAELRGRHSGHPLQREGSTLPCRGMQATTGLVSCSASPGASRSASGCDSGDRLAVCSLRTFFSSLRQRSSSPPSSSPSLDPRPACRCSFLVATRHLSHLLPCDARGCRVRSQCIVYLRCVSGAASHHHAGIRESWQHVGFVMLLLERARRCVPIRCHTREACPAESVHCAAAHAAPEAAGHHLDHGDRVGRDGAAVPSARRLPAGRTARGQHVRRVRPLWYEHVAFVTFTCRTRCRVGASSLCVEKRVNRAHPQTGRMHALQRHDL